MCKCLEKAFRHWGWGEVKGGGEGDGIAISGESTDTHSCAPPGLPGKPTLLGDAGGSEGAASGSPQIFRPLDAVSFQHCDSGDTKG